jgi:hypothetical protein
MRNVAQPTDPTHTCMNPEPAPTPLSIEQFHRQLATELFNGVWALLEKQERTCAETDRMIHAAHASRFHWEFGGSPVNFALGEWQCSRVHAEVKQPDAARFHAMRSLELAEDFELGAFHLAYAHEALARAHALGKNVERATEHLAKARRFAGEIPEAEERELIERDLSQIEAISRTAAA